MSNLQQRTAFWKQCQPRNEPHQTALATEYSTGYSLPARTPSACPNLLSLLAFYAQAGPFVDPIIPHSALYV